MGHLARGPSITHVLLSIALQCASINVEHGVNPRASCRDWFFWTSTRLQRAAEGSGLHPEDGQVEMEAELQQSSALQGCEHLGLNAIVCWKLNALFFSLDDVFDKIK